MIDQHTERISQLAEETQGLDEQARAAHQRRDTAIREAADAGLSPRQLVRAGVPLSEASIYRIIGTAS